MIPQLHFDHQSIIYFTQRAFAEEARVQEADKLVDEIYDTADEIRAPLRRFIRSNRLDLIVVENALTIPMNLPLGITLTGLIAELGVNTIAHHHDFFWERQRYQSNLQAGGGGRVTELVARPLFNLFYPELSGIVQPLSGEYAGRRQALEQVPFYVGYGVETGLLLSLVERYGISGIAQVDLRQRIHHNQSLGALSRMAFAIIQVFIDHLESREKVQLLSEINRTMKIIRHETESYYPEEHAISDQRRPPIITLPEYRARHGITD